MRKLLLILITICGVMLTGCAQLIEINDQESDVLAEYMAGTMLRHDSNYEEALIYQETTDTADTTDSADISETGEITEPDETLDPSDKKSNDTGVSSSAVSQATSDLYADKQNGSIVSLASLYKEIFKDKFSIKYINHKFYSSYPDEYDFFTLESTKDHKLLAINFNIKNTSTKARTLDLKNNSIKYQLTDKTNAVYNPMMTLLNNDIQYINLDVAAGKTQQAVVMFDVPKNMDISDLKLAITYEDKTTVIDLN
ncbi:DUF4352 domain-containing protein [Anaerocolumna sedimenticola]|uniref:DUF4352 domain-containing protein n=1 Tax=Anaerocolumna sedimenticola TaxID=2696063 RepID=A0A6P1TP01_9FIRM|nr:DUF4352 domain-containing protein [Anaerocolumna sedimenticola]QHQ62714.1 DUF4352 domain-containing protein [Anaerocolumna sedimenticola]